MASETSSTTIHDINKQPALAPLNLMDNSATIRHPTFYFNEPDTISIQLGKVVFRVHSVFIRRYFSVLNDSLTISGGLQQSDASDPIVLEDVSLGQDGVATEVTPEAFEVALRALYPEHLFDNPLQTTAEWMTVHKLALRWDSSYLERLSLSHLPEASLTLHERVDMALNHGQYSWISKAYIELCLLRNRPTRELVSLLPFHHLHAVMDAREAARNRFLILTASEVEWRGCTVTREINYYDPSNHCIESDGTRRRRALDSLGLLSGRDANVGHGHTITAYFMSPLPRPIIANLSGEEPCAVCVTHYEALEEQCIEASMAVLVEAGVVTKPHLASTVAST